MFFLISLPNVNAYNVYFKKIISNYMLKDCFARKNKNKKKLTIHKNPNIIKEKKSKD